MTNAENDPNEKFNAFQDSLLNVINKHVPFKKISRKVHRLRTKPWITTGILKSISILINGMLTTDQKIIANCFNEYFTTVAQKLVDKMKPAKKHFRDYLKIPNPRSFFIQPITPQEINDLIANLDETKANDSYDIPAKLIKLARHTISLPFSLIANSSFENGIFPGKLKFCKGNSNTQGQIKTRAY